MDEVILWVGGPAKHGHVPGVRAIGVVAGPVFQGRGEGPWRDAERQQERRNYVPMFLTWLEPPIPRDEIARHPALRDIEILRMPRMANPSYLTEDQANALGEVLDEHYSAPVRYRLQTG
jgi:hypothetical protein